jgi:hypothetical protein
LISRFIDSEAQFIFAPKMQVLERARKEGAIAFDTPGAEFNRKAICAPFM